jgi:hypothetical protein
VNETAELLAPRAPKFRQAVREAKKAWCACVILDGTLIPVDRLAAGRWIWGVLDGIPKEANRAHAKLLAPGERAKRAAQDLEDSH